MSTFTSPPSYSLCGVAGEFLLSAVGILVIVFAFGQPVTLSAG